VKLPTLSIAARLYAIFALMAATTVALSVYAVSNARFHAALTEEFESANAGSWNVERGIYMSADVADAASARNDRNPSQRQRDGAASVTGPISDITSVTEAVAAGDAAITIPFTDRRDEIGALARSIGIFQTAMRKNVELNRTWQSGRPRRDSRRKFRHGMQLAVPVAGGASTASAVRHLPSSATSLERLSAR
jgi:methyl-accepting chemotaxis protein